MSFVMGVCYPIKSVFVGCYLGKSMGDEGKDCGMGMGELSSQEAIPRKVLRNDFWSTF